MEGRVGTVGAVAIVRKDKLKPGQHFTLVTDRGKTELTVLKKQNGSVRIKAEHGAYTKEGWLNAAISVDHEFNLKKDPSNPRSEVVVSAGVVIEIRPN